MAAHRGSDEGALLLTANKILTDLQAMGTCCLVPSVAPWQLTLECSGVAFPFLQEQVCDIFDSDKGKIDIKEFL